MVAVNHATPITALSDPAAALRCLGLDVGAGVVVEPEPAVAPLEGHAHHPPVNESRDVEGTPRTFRRASSPAGDARRPLPMRVSGAGQVGETTSETGSAEARIHDLLRRVAGIALRQSLREPRFETGAPDDEMPEIAEEAARASEAWSRHLEEVVAPMRPYREAMAGWSAAVDSARRRLAKITPGGGRPLTPPRLAAPDISPSDGTSAAAVAAPPSAATTPEGPPAGGDGPVGPDGARQGGARCPPVRAILPPLGAEYAGSIPARGMFLRAGAHRGGDDVAAAAPTGLDGVGDVSGAMGKEAPPPPPEPASLVAGLPPAAVGGLVPPRDAEGAGSTPAGGEAKPSPLPGGTEGKEAWSRSGVEHFGAPRPSLASVPPVAAGKGPPGSSPGAATTKPPAWCGGHAPGAVSQVEGARRDNHLAALGRPGRGGVAPYVAAPGHHRPRGERQPRSFAPAPGGIPSRRRRVARHACHPPVGAAPSLLSMPLLRRERAPP